VELRKEAGRDVGSLMTLPLSTQNWYSGTGVSFSYNGDFFGANVSFDFTTGGDPYWDRDKREWRDRYPISAGDMNAWVKPFGDLLKLSLGRGIGSGFISSQGGEDLRVYTGGTRFDNANRDGWDSNRSSDNISQGEGILLEGFFGPLALALAGRYSSSNLFTISLNPNDPIATQDTKYVYTDQYTFSYGARIGYEINQMVRLSASYIVEFDNGTGDNFRADDRDDNIIKPVSGDAYFTRNLFGLNTSFNVINDLGISIGYNGVFTQYPKQLLSAGNMVDLAKPTVLQQGFSFNLRYSGLENWVLRTDHNFSFYGDKDYSIYRIPQLGNIGLSVASDLTRSHPTINHLYLWNGLGFNYRFSDTFRLDFYVRNLHRRSTANDPENNIEFLFTKNLSVCEIKGIWQPRGNYEFFIGITAENTVTFVSQEVGRRSTGQQDGFTVAANAKDIRDTLFYFKVPFGMTVRFR